MIQEESLGRIIALRTNDFHVSSPMLMATPAGTAPASNVLETSAYSNHALESRFSTRMRLRFALQVQMPYGRFVAVGILIYLGRMCFCQSRINSICALQRKSRSTDARNV